MIVKQGKKNQRCWDRGQTAQVRSFSTESYLEPHNHAGFLHQRRQGRRLEWKTRGPQALCLLCVGRCRVLNAPNSTFFCAAFTAKNRSNDA